MLAVAALSGCGAGGSGGSGGGEKRDEGAAKSEQQADEGAFVDSSIEADDPGTIGETSCLLGEWTLDLLDYQDQAHEWLLSLGAPVDFLSMSGRYTLLFTLNEMAIFSNITSDTSILGHPATVVTNYEGIGDWFWEGDSAPSISIHDWTFTTPPGDADPEAPEIPSVFDPTLPGAIPVFCVGDSLSIKGPDAPLAGNFTRTA